MILRAFTPHFLVPKLLSQDPAADRQDACHKFNGSYDHIYDAAFDGITMVYTVYMLLCYK